MYKRIMGDQMYLFEMIRKETKSRLRQLNKEAREIEKDKAEMDKLEALADKAVLKQEL